MDTRRRVIAAAALIVGMLGCQEGPGDGPGKPELGTRRQAVIAGVNVQECQAGSECSSRYCIDISWMGFEPGQVCTEQCDDARPCAPGWGCNEEVSPAGIRDGFCVPMLAGQEEVANVE